MSSDSPTSGPGLVISTTKPILSFLISASTDPHLSKELQKTASNLSSKPNVPYRSIRALWVASGASTRPESVKLFSGSGFVFTSPKLREKSEELKARLEKLAEMSERNASTSLSLLTRINWALNAAGGILGLVIGMLVETLIFIIEASRFDLRSSSSTSNLKKNQ